MTLLFNSNQKWLRAETSKCSAYFDYIWLCSPSSKLQTCQQNVNSHCHEMKIRGVNSHCHEITIQSFSSIPVTQVDALRSLHGTSKSDGTVIDTNGVLGTWAVNYQQLYAVCLCRLIQNSSHAFWLSRNRLPSLRTPFGKEWIFQRGPLLADFTQFESSYSIGHVHRLCWHLTGLLSRWIATRRWECVYFTCSRLWSWFLIHLSSPQATWW